MAASERGLALIDVVVAAGLSLVLAAIAVPVVGGTLDREHVIVGTQYLAAQLQRARLESLKRGAAVAVRFEQLDGRTAIQLFVDGNGNGVLQKDIDRLADPVLTPVNWIDDHARGVALRINQPIADVGTGGAMATGADPLRIGNSSLVSFSPLGGSTSGTLYLAAQRGPQMAIRIYGATGRVRVLMFDARARQWRP
ncbi:MAG: GspH/FimT family pseudopilin [Acidobacteriota bacterium]|nr:GspH/FimT family pseudopilin [Acidobacteriota bacterium]